MNKTIVQVNFIQFPSTSFSSHVLLLACSNHVNLSTINLDMHQIVSSTSLTFRFSSPYGCKWPKPHSNKHVPYPKKSHQQHTPLKQAPHIFPPWRNIERPFYLEKKTPKDKTAPWVSTASSMGHLWIVGTSWPKCWHHCHQREARSRRLDPVEVWRIKLSPKDWSSLQRTNSSHLKNGGWETAFNFWSLPIFRCYVSVRGG